MILIVLGTIFAGLLGLAFGSFLNVCVTRWPEEESIVSPRSHCRTCGRSLVWRENIPLASWLALRGRCAGCSTWIGWRYPITEFAVGFCWALAAWQTLPALYAPGWTATSVFDAFFFGFQKLILSWLLIALAVLDAEHLWLPDRFTLGGAVLGIPFAFFSFAVHWVWRPAPLHWTSGMESHAAHIFEAIIHWTLGVLLVPAVFLLTRWAYRSVRKREGMGLGDVKLILLLAVWLGLPRTILASVLGIIFATIYALVLLFRRNKKGEDTTWALTRLPLGTFLCAAGVISTFWGTELIEAYLRFADVLP